MTTDIIWILIDDTPTPVTIAGENGHVPATDESLGWIEYMLECFPDENYFVAPAPQ
jgi:hypothetical protein